MTSQSSPSRHLLCMKWGDKYAAADVNALFFGLQRTLSPPFVLHCLTDDPRGIRPEIDCRPLPELALPPELPERGWRKLTTFGEALRDLDAPILFLDLDVVLLRPIDHFFTHAPASGLHIIKDWKHPRRITGNSSVYRFHPRLFPELLRDFVRDFAAIRRQFRNEQAYLSHYAQSRGALHYWPAHWCQSYKYHALYPFPQSLWKTPRQPDCDILIFHGEITPRGAVTGGGGKWYRHVRPAPWLAAYVDEDHAA